MKKEGHPPYQDVLFVDTATGYRFVCGSTLQPKETEKFEGKEYPVYRLSISSASHPFFTGSQQFIDSEGRVDKFMKRYSQAAANAKKIVEEEKEEKDDSKKSPKAKKPAAKKKS
ncbi:MAG: type B 50S ribosomal protein L31 [Chlamydiales bacterium]|nr:type B 50S ribosomal protein L31 [Chlamydiales bacterium]